MQKDRFQGGYKCPDWPIWVETIFELFGKFMDTKKYFGVKMIEPKEDDFAYFEPHFMAQNCSFPGKIELELS